MHNFRMILAAMLLVLTSGSALLAQEPATTGGAAPNGAAAQSQEQAPANRLLFSPSKRTVALPKGGQDLAALGTLGIFLLIGAAQLLKKGVAGPSFVILLGTMVFYGAWVYHKWTISGREVILYGHLISLGIGSLGVAIGAGGLLALGRNVRANAPGDISRLWILPLALLLTLGVVTGTATIFEAGPTIFGVDAPLYRIVLMVFLGSCASAASIVAFARGYCRMA